VEDDEFKPLPLLCWPRADAERGVCLERAGAGECVGLEPPGDRPMYGLAATPVAAAARGLGGRMGNTAGRSPVAARQKRSERSRQLANSTPKGGSHATLGSSVLAFAEPLVQALRK
jgi:hypothetical protein